MSSLAVDKFKKKVTLSMADQSQLSGYIFLSQYSELGAGRETVIEALTKKEAKFIPFETSEGEFYFLNPNQIVWLAGLVDKDSAPPLPPDKRNVTVHLRDGKRLRGDIVMALPEEKSRLSDWLNEAESFLVIRDEKREVLINLHFVVKVA